MSAFSRLLAVVALACTMLPSISWSDSTNLGKIMFLGNSYIEGHDSPNLSWQGGARKVVEDILSSASATFEFVGRNDWNSAGMSNPLHNGYGGKGIDDLINGFTRDGVDMGKLADWVQESGANIYVIDIGRKDEEGTTVEELKTQFTRFVNEIYAVNPEARIIWTEQVAPKEIWFPTAKAHLANVNEALRQVSLEQNLIGRNLQIAETANDWDPEAYLDTDGIHASDAGYTFIGGRQAAMILQQAPPAVPEPFLLAGLPAALAVMRRRRQKS